MRAYVVGLIQHANFVDVDAEVPTQRFLVTSPPWRERGTTGLKFVQFLRLHTLVDLLVAWQDAPLGEEFQILIFRRLWH